MENLEVTAGDWNKRWLKEMRQSSIGCTEYLSESQDTPVSICVPLPPGGSMWQPSWTSEDFGTQLPARRFWRWPGTWNYLKVVPYHQLGIAPSLLTFRCPAHPSASASLSSWGASLSPGWPGPVWLVCPCGLILHRQLEPEPNAEAPGTHAAAEIPSSLPCDSLPETPTSGMAGALDLPPSPECPL